MLDHLIDHLTQFGIKPNRVISMDSCDDVRTLSNICSVLGAPFHPFVILIAYLHCFTRSIARRTCFS